MRQDLPAVRSWHVEKKKDRPDAPQTQRHGTMSARLAGNRRDVRFIVSKPAPLGRIIG